MTVCVNAANISIPLNLQSHVISTYKEQQNFILSMFFLLYYKRSSLFPYIQDLKNTIFSSSNF